MPSPKRSLGVALLTAAAAMTVTVGPGPAYAAAATSPAAVNGPPFTKPAVMNLRGPLVNASFSSVDPTGCVFTDVAVAANSGTVQELPTTTAVGVASVSIYEYNDCTQTTLLDAAGLDEALPAAAFQVSRQLDAAALTTTVTVSDLVSGQSFPVAVDMAWTGTSDIVRNHSNTNEIYPGCHVINRWKGSGRDAVASGSVTDATTKLPPSASQYAEIGYVIDGFEIIGCE